MIRRSILGRLTLGISMTPEAAGSGGVPGSILVRTLSQELASNSAGSKAPAHRRSTPPDYVLRARSTSPILRYPSTPVLIYHSQYYTPPNQSAPLLYYHPHPYNAGNGTRAFQNLASNVDEDEDGMAGELDVNQVFLLYVPPLLTLSLHTSRAEGAHPLSGILSGFFF